MGSVSNDYFIPTRVLAMLIAVTTSIFSHSLAPCTSLGFAFTLYRCGSLGNWNCITYFDSTL
jgi:hypothetical protein